MERTLHFLLFLYTLLLLLFHFSNHDIPLPDDSCHLGSSALSLLSLFPLTIPLTAAFTQEWLYPTLLFPAISLSVSCIRAHPIFSKDNHEMPRYLQSESRRQGSCPRFFFWLFFAGVAALIIGLLVVSTPLHRYLFFPAGLYLVRASLPQNGSFIICGGGALSCCLVFV